MDKDREKILSLAREGKYEEARQYVKGLDISEREKARLSMDIWQLQNRLTSPQSTGQPIPKLPVISLILGFVFICTAAGFQGDATTVLLVIGFLLLIPIPAWYCLKEKRQLDIISKKPEIESYRYADEGADINFAKPAPPPGVVKFFVIGIVLMIIALASFELFKSAGTMMAFALITAGFASFTKCSKDSRRHNGTIMLGTLTICSALFFICFVAKFVSPGAFGFFLSVFGSASSVIMLLFPFIFKNIKLRKCTDTVEAECVDIFESYSRFHGRRHHNYRPTYRAFWKYTYNGVTYVHKDMAAYDSPYYGEKIDLLIDPEDPHNIYRGKSPVSRSYFFAAGALTLLLIILSML